MKEFDIKTFDPKPGITLIEASAGTGKTFSITEIVTDLIASGRCKIEEILLLTFTNAATAELKDRIRLKLQETYDLAVRAQDSHRCETLSLALDQFDFAVIQTIHGFCQKILHEFSVECGLSIEFEVLKDTDPFNKEVRNSVIRRIQKESIKNPILIPFCSWLEFEGNYINTIWDNLNFRSKLSDINDHTTTESLSQTEAALEKLKNSWGIEKDEIKTILLHPKECPLYKTKYPTELIEEACDSFSHWEKHGAISVKLFKLIETFSKKQLIRSLKKNAELPDFQFFRDCDQFIKTVDRLLTIVLKIIHNEATLHLERLNEKEQKLRYDDLLLRLRNSIRTNDALKAQLRLRYQVGLIDEFQDTDSIQFSILNDIFISPITPQPELTAKPLILIGDPKQAIYSFRGGDIFTYQKAKNCAVEQFYLATNWRSSPEINDGVNTLLRKESGNPFVFSWLDYEEVRTTESNQQKSIQQLQADSTQKNLSGIHLHSLPKNDYKTQISICKKLVSDVSQVLSSNHLIFNNQYPGGRKVELSDIAILVSKNHLGAKIRKELSQARIPAVISGGASVFESTEAVTWHRILIALYEPKNSKRLRAALSTPLFPHKGIQSLIELEHDYDTWNQYHRSFSQAHHKWELGHLGQAISELSQQYQWDKNLSESSDPQRSLANHYHLLELLLEAQHSQNHTPTSLIDWLEEKIRDPNTSNETELLRLERDTQSINILTLHKSKGLQYPIVFIPFALDAMEKKDITPPFVYHNDTGHSDCIFSKSQLTEEIESQKRNEVMSEKLRLLYVGITRAEYMCHLYAKDPFSDRDPLTYWLKSLDQKQPFKNHDLAERTSPIDNQNQIDELNRTHLIKPESPPQCPRSITNWSFSGMIRQQNNHIEAGYDEEPLIRFQEPDSGNKSIDRLYNLHNFEKGTHAGLFFHGLLEYVDFKTPSSWSDLVDRLLNEYGYDTPTWSPTIISLLNQLSTAPIFPENSYLSLQDIQPDRLFRETEFTFPMAFDISRYVAIKKQFENETGYSLPTIDRIEEVIHGYMKGVIDLWAEHHGYIYLVDWKSNWLGEEQTHYTQSEISSSMNEHQYHLQYLIYLCALHRYLRVVMPEFNYDLHFGGISYVFLRGLSNDTPNEGCFHYKPKLQIIEGLNSCFLYD